MNERLRNQKCSVQIGICRHAKCGRPAVLEITEKGAHRMYLCKKHSNRWQDKNGISHDPVWRGLCMIPREYMED
jgi:hypothetical protein